MNLRSQRYVLAIGRHGSIKEAARELCISPPTLSIFLRNLEKELGLVLFDRIGKKFVPTSAGEAYIKYSHEMVRLGQEFYKVLDDIREGDRGVITVGLHRRRTTYLLPSVLGRFTKSHPDVDIRFCEAGTEELFNRILSGDLDVIVNSYIHKDPSLEYIPFYTDRLVLVVPESHKNISKSVSLEGEELPWMDLSLFDGETFILQKTFQSSRKYVDQAMDYSHARPGKTVEISNMEAASQMASEGIGIAFNLLSYTRSYNYPKPVRYFLVGDPQVDIPYFIIRRSDRYRPSYLGDFIDTMKIVWNSYL